MKHIMYVSRILAFIVVVLIVSCADDKDLFFNVEKPSSIEQMEYLKDYAELKSYINRTLKPDFKLGAGVTVSDYIKRGLVYRLVNSNFDEVTAGNAMKYSSCVKDDGSMDFSQVVSFIEAAKAENISVYGHTLCWHAQQNNKYLNSLLEDKKLGGESGEGYWEQIIRNGDCEGDDFSLISTTDMLKGESIELTANGEGVGGKGRAIKVINTIVRENDYDYQFFVVFSPPLEIGEKYRFKIDIRADEETTFSAQAHIEPQEYKHWDMINPISVTSEWQTYEQEFVVSPDQEGTGAFAFGLGKCATTYYFDNISLEHYEEGGASTIVRKYVVQSDFEDGLVLMGWGNNSTREVVDGEGYNNSRGLKIINPSVVNSWEVQAGYDFPNPLIEGETYYLNLKIKGSIDGAIGAAFQKPDGYVGRGDFPSIPISTDWENITVQANVTGDGTTRFLFNLGAYSGTILMDDISIYSEELGSSIPLTPEEKADTITWALERWIAGMMEVCDGYVKSWDVVNEPMSDSNAFELKYSSNVSEEEAKNNFYWQDYLGKDYARIAIKFARQYGGEDLKLFINDYNLEAVYNSNAKCEGLLNMVNYWESDGITKIDGIGTQMHVTYSMNPENQKKNEECVVRMFELLASSGKLVKISEMDMGISDENGNTILSVDVTEIQHKAMAEYYKFIVKKYFEIIPVSQQYGITQWATTDSPVDSGWRKGEPIGLWDLNFNRKYTYAGFADGLSESMME